MTQPPSGTERRAKLQGTLADWTRFARKARDKHNAAADRYHKWDGRVGLPAALASAVVGSAVFASLQSGATFGVRLGVVIVSLIAAGLAGAQAFLHYAERSETYRRASRRYGRIAREIELLDTRASVLTEDDLYAALEHIAIDLDQADDASPNVPPSIWFERKQKSGRSRHPREFAASLAADADPPSGAPDAAKPPPAAESQT